MYRVIPLKHKCIFIHKHRGVFVNVWRKDINQIANCGCHEEENELGVEGYFYFLLYTCFYCIPFYSDKESF